MSDLASQLRKLDVSKLKMKNGKTVESELKRHAAILADCIMESLDKVYDSYSPKIYKRTYDLYNSLYIDNGVKVDVSSGGAGLSIGVHFDDGAMHENFYGKDSNVAVLFNEGWNWNNGVSIPYFSERSGEHFIERGIENYKKRVSNPFTVKLTINNETRTF